MGESKRRKDAGEYPEKTERRRPTWEDKLTPEQLEEGRRDRAYLLDYNIGKVREVYRNVLNAGVTWRPVIFVADLRDGYGQGYAPPESNKEEVLRFYAESGMVPTATVPIPYETALDHAAEMTPNGRTLLERAAAVPETIPVVVIASRGTSYASIPLEGEFTAVVTPFNMLQ